MAKERDRSAASDQHNARGIELADRGWLDEAIREFQKALELDPESAHALGNLAAVYAEKRMWREALAAHLRAVELDPEAAVGHHDLAAFVATHGLEMAVDEYREAAARDPEHPDVHLNLGLALADLGQTDEALRELQAAVRIEPKDAFARHELAALLMDEGDYRSAIGHLKEVVRLEPDSFEVHLDLGICYGQKGFYAEAERAYGRAREIRPDDLLLHYNAAALYALWGRPARSLESLRLALAADPAKVRRWLAHDRMFESMKGREDYQALTRG